MIKTYSAKPSEVTRKWYIIDAADQVIGQVAVKAAMLLRGKHKPIFTTHIDTGDHVIIINAEKARFTGNKEIHKIYTRYTGYVGNQKVETPKKIRLRHPELLLEYAVKGMVPKTRLGRAQLGKLKVYQGDQHPHASQNPETVEI